MVNPFKTPILFNVFNRPDCTKKVFAAIKLIKPKYLYVHCDGARKNNIGDIDKVNDIRKVILEGVDWDCELKILFRDENLGCGLGPASAITWFFENVDEGIILEDDCLPHPDFFYYCTELLNKYRDNKSIYIIGGTNFETHNEILNTSYRFTAYAGIWGWATWKRTWDLFDFDFNIPRKDFENSVNSFIKNKYAVKYWADLLEKVKADTNKSYWDYQLHLALLYNHAVHIKPCVNLIENIGFGKDATHTMYEQSVYANRKTGSILPLKHPVVISLDLNKDNAEYAIPWKKRIKKIIKRIFDNAK